MKKWQKYRLTRGSVPHKGGFILAVLFVLVQPKSTCSRIIPISNNSVSTLELHYGKFATFVPIHWTRQDVFHLAQSLPLETLGLGLPFSLNSKLILLIVVTRIHSTEILSITYLCTYRAYYPRRKIIVPLTLSNNFYAMSLFPPYIFKLSTFNEKFVSVYTDIVLCDFLFLMYRSI